MSWQSGKAEVAVLVPKLDEGKQQETGVGVGLYLQCSDSPDIRIKTVVVGLGLFQQLRFPHEP